VLRDQNCVEMAWRVPEVSTMVVVSVLLVLTSGGMVMTGTTVWILEIKVSFTKDVTSLRSVQ
jgi:ABC-type polysaccharide/polyol phosphate transport system ATPase subunit